MASPVVFCFTNNIIFFIAKAGKRVYNKNNKVVGGKMINDHKLNFEKSDFIKYTKIFEEYRKTLENSTENAKSEIKLYAEYPREISNFQRIFFNSDLVDFEYDRTMNERGWYNEKKLRKISAQCRKRKRTLVLRQFSVAKDFARDLSTNTLKTE